MPAEAVHLTALEDTLVDAPARVRARVCDPPLREAARLGAVFVDLPYFDRFGMVLVNYVTKRPQAVSPWGDTLHQRAPIALGRALAEAGARLERASATREEGARLLAMAVGHFSHAAVDTALHPLVNRLAADRAAALGDSPSRQHNEVEKFQSVLFHLHRHGFPFLGTTTLTACVAVDTRLVTERGTAGAAVEAALREALGEAPEPGLLRRFARGYATYARILASPAGRLLVRPGEREAERAALFDAVDFLGRYAQALRRSRRFVAALCEYLDDGRFDDSARAALSRVVPETTLDPPPEDAPPGPEPPGGW